MKTEHLLTTTTLTDTWTAVSAVTKQIYERLHNP